MKKYEYIALNELAEHQKKHPGTFPIFNSIQRIDGQLIGAVEAYSDEFGNRYPLGATNEPIN